MNLPACHDDRRADMPTVCPRLCMNALVRRRTQVILIILTLACWSIATSGQQQIPFKSGASTVAVYATVTDEIGRLVPDLHKDDFEIYDNGKLQPITLFANETQPIAIVVMLDRSGSMRRNFNLVAAGAEELVRRLLPEDKARIGSFAARIQLDPETFTSDRQTLLNILRTELQPEGPTPLWNAATVAMTALSHQENRKVVLLFTDGRDNPMNFRTNNVTERDVIERATREDMMVYAIGLSGSTPYGHRQAPMRGRSGGWGGGGFGRYGGHGGGRGTTEGPDPGLPKLADETGGGYFELTPEEDLRTTFGRVADELHHQYALGFEPAKLDGKTHKLEVRIKKNGLKARARRSYVAVKPVVGTSN
jgi:VWFA-related protein